MTDPAVTTNELDAASETSFAILRARIETLEADHKLPFQLGFSAGCNYIIELLKEKGML